MSAVGYAVLPITPSLRGLGAELSKELMEPARKAAKAASADMEKSLAGGAKRAAAEVSKARQSEQKAAEAVTKAEQALADTRSKAERDARSIESAELKLTAARQKGTSDVTKAENDLAAARDAGDVDAITDAESKLAQVRNRTDSTLIDRENALDRARQTAQASARKVTDAEGDVAQAKNKAAEASENVVAATKRYDDAVDGSAGVTADMADELKRLQDDLSGTGGELDSAGDKVSGFGAKLRDSVATMAKGALLGIGADIGRSVLNGVTSAMREGWESALAVDSGRRVLTGLYGDAEQAAAMMAGLRDVAADSPIDYTSYQSAAEALAYTGIEGEQATRILENVGLAAVSAGRGDQAFDSMNQAMARMVNEGKVGLESLQQLSGAGVPILSGLAEHFGVSMEEVNKMASSGAIGFEDVLSVMENATGDYFQNALVAGEAASESLGGQWDMAKDRIVTAIGFGIAPALDQLAPLIGTAGEFLGQLVEGFFAVASSIGDAVTWIRETEWAMALLVGAITGVSVALLPMLARMAMAGIAAAVSGVAAAFQAVRTAVLAVNAAMRANAFGLIMAAVAALVAGLTYFFTQTELGQELWGKFTDALSAGWEWVKAAFQSAWDFIQPILQGLGDFFSWVGEIIGGVFSWMVDNWQWVVAAVFGPLGAVIALAITHWDTLRGAIQVVWDAITGAISWAWNAIIMPVWNGMQAALGALGAFFQWVWSSVIQPAWNALGAGIAFVWTSVIQPTWNALQTALGAVGTFFQWVWNSVIKPAWDALGNGIRLVIDSVIRPAFDGMKSALQSVGDFFSTIVGGIQRVWDQLRGHVARPINFVIDTVWNNGLVRAWNTIADFLPGLPRASTLSPVAFATGGAVYGPGTATSDSIPARLSAGEHVLTAAEVKAFGGHGQVYAMRKMAMNGVWPMGHGPDAMPKFRDGGEVGTGVRLAPTPGEGGLQAIAILAKRLIHRIWPSIGTIGGYRGEDGYGEHSSGRALDVMVGVGNPIGDEVTSWALANDPVIPLQHAIWKQQMWYPGVAGGSMMEDRGNPTQNHYDHPHLWYKNVHMDPNVVPEGLVGHDGLTREDRLGVIKEKISEIIDKMMDPLIDGMSAAIGDPPPEWLGIMPKVADKSKDGAVDAAFDFVEKIGDDLRDVYNAAREVKNIVVGRITGLWRDEGGFIPTGQSIVTNETGRPEAVLNWQQLERVREILGSLSSLSELQFLADVVSRMASTGAYDPRASRFGIDSEDDDLVRILWAAREQWMTTAGQIESLFQQAGTKALDGYRDEALDFFGFKGLHDDLTGLWGELHPAPGAATGAASAVTSGISGPVTDATTDLVYGNPSVRLELEEVELETKMPDLDTGTAGTGPVADQVREAMAAHGWDSGPQWEAVDWIINKESTWNPTAQNPTSTAYGLFQFLDTTWPTVGATKTDNPKLQAEAGAAYIKQRYGDPLGAKRFWEANGWYDRGGLAFGKGLMAKGTLSPERVLSPAQTAAFESWMASGAAASVIDASHWQAIDSLLESLPSAAQFARVAALGDSVAVPAVVERVQASPLQAPAGWSGQSGPLVHIENQYAMDAEEAAREQMREARRASRSAGLVGGWQ